MKIVFLNDSMCGGGAEKAMANIVNELSKKHDIQLISLENSFCLDLNPNIEITYFNNHIHSKMKKLLGLIIDAYRLKKFLKRNAYPVVVSFQYRSNFINVISKCMGSKHRVIVNERNYPKKSLEYLPFFSFLLKRLYPKADLVLCNASDTKKLFLNEYGFKNVKLIFNGYDKNKIIQLSKEPISIEYEYIFSKDVILNVGRLTQQKGQVYLLKAFALLDSQKYHLLLIGQGELESSLKELAKELKIEKRVFFIGYQNNPYKFINKSQIFVFTSLYEGFPNALSEALICQIAIVSFNFKSGANDLIEKKNLVQIGDIMSLSKAIQDARIEPDRTLDILDVAKDYEDFITELLND